MRLQSWDLVTAVLNSNGRLVKAYNLPLFNFYHQYNKEDFEFEIWAVNQILDKKMDQHSLNVCVFSDEESGCPTNILHKFFEVLVALEISLEDSSFYREAFYKIRGLLYVYRGYSYRRPIPFDFIKFIIKNGISCEERKEIHENFLYIKNSLDEVLHGKKVQKTVEVLQLLELDKDSCDILPLMAS